jgi:hypothetical protein
VKDLYKVKYKKMKKEIKGLSRIQKDLPCPQIRRNDIVKITVLLIMIYRFNVISIKIPMTFFTEIEKKF